MSISSESDARVAARASLALLLPAAAIEAALALGWWDGRLAAASGRARRILTACFPGADPSWDGVRPALALAALLLVGVHSLPPSRRRPALAAAAVALLAWMFGPGPAALYLAAAALLWAACRSEAFALRAGGLLPAGLLLAAFSAASAPLVRNRAIMLSVLTLLRAYGAAVDRGAARSAPTPTDHLLGLTGGFPVNACGPHYPYAAFGASYLARPYAQIARRGVALVYAALCKLVILALLGHLLSLMNLNIRSMHRTAYLTTPELWVTAFALVAENILQICAVFQLLQGFNALFGWDVEEQCRRPWLMTSPLDLWRRLTAVDRAYMIKYAAYPVARRTGSMLAAFPVVFFLVAVVDFSGALPVNPGRQGPEVVAVAVQTALYFAAFTILCSLEYALTGGAPAPASGPRRALAVARAWVLFAVLILPGRRGLNLPSISPALVPGETLAQRYAAVWGGLLGIRAGAPR